MLTSKILFLKYFYFQFKNGLCKNFINNFVSNDKLNKKRKRFE